METREKSNPMKSHLLSLALLALCAATAQAQKYPAKPIRLISPFAPGGGTNILSRTIGPHLTATIEIGRAHV